MKFHYYLFFLLVIVSLFLIGGGLTGKVISQSCCFPPHCAEENLCEASQDYFLESPGHIQDETSTSLSMVLGLAVLVGSIGLLLLQHYMKKNGHTAS